MRGGHAPYDTEAPRQTTDGPKLYIRLLAGAPPSPPPERELLTGVGQLRQGAGAKPAPGRARVEGAPARTPRACREVAVSDRLQWRRLNRGALLSPALSGGEPSGRPPAGAYGTVRHVTPCLRSSSRIDMPPRWSRRIAAYSATFDTRGMTSAFHQKHVAAALTSVPPKLGSGTDLGERSRRVTSAFDCEGVSSRETACALPSADRE